VYKRHSESVVGSIELGKRFLELVLAQSAKEITDPAVIAHDARMLETAQRKREMQILDSAHAAAPIKQMNDASDAVFRIFKALRTARNNMKPINHPI
jgi:phospholipid N-methyltransferase